MNDELLHALENAEKNIAGAVSELEQALKLAEERGDRGEVAGMINRELEGLIETDKWIGHILKLCR